MCNALKKPFGRFDRRWPSVNEPDAARSPLPPWLEPLEIEFADTIDLNSQDETLLIELPEHGIDGSLPRVTRPEFGADSLAFYLPFHFYRTVWGIYIWSGGVLHLAVKLKAGVLVPGDEHLLVLATKILVEHELFHFMVEVSSGRAELVARSQHLAPLGVKNTRSYGA